MAEGMKKGITDGMEKGRLHTLAQLVVSGDITEDRAREKLGECTEEMMIYFSETLAELKNAN